MKIEKMKIDFNKVVSSKFSKFIYGGVINYVLKIGITTLLTEIFAIWYFASYIISLIGVITYSFFYNTYVTYNVKNNIKVNFVKFSIVLLIFMVFDALLVKFLTEIIRIHYVYSIIIVTIILFFAKYFYYDKFIFIKKKEFVNIAGNHYDKHHNKNPIIKFLMKKFHQDLFSLIKKAKPSSILDVGCGEGYTTKLIIRIFPHLKIEGCELDEKILQIAKKQNPKIRFTQCSIYKLKNETSSFDLTIVSEVLEHLEETNKAIKEVKRVSAKYCIFTVPYEPYWRIANMLRGAYWRNFGNTPGHIQHWNKGNFKRMLKKHFKNVKIKQSLLWNIALCKKE